MNNNIPPGYKQTEVGVIPEDWNTVTLDSATVKGGLVRGPFGGTLKKEFFVERGYKVYEQRNAIYATVGMGDYFIDLNKYKELERFHVHSGDFIVSCSGTIGCIYQIPVGAPKGVINQALLKITLNDEIVNDAFFLAVFRSESFQERIKENSHGGAMQNLVGMDVFRKTPFQLPPKAEQEAIAEALSDVDALIESLEQLIAKKRQIKQGAMQELLSGKKRLPGFSGEWEVKRLGEMAELKNGYAFKSSTYTPLGQFSVVTIANVQDGYMVLDECNKIDILPSDIQPHHRLQLGDILISMTGNVGRVCRVSEVNCLLNQRVGKLIPFGVDTNFLFALIGQRRFLAAMTGKAKGGAQGNLSIADITESQFTLPPTKSEQTAIATILSDMDAKIAALEEKLAKARQLKQSMMHNLLTGKIRLVGVTGSSPLRTHPKSR